MFKALCFMLPVVLVLGVSCSTDPKAWETYFEKSGGLETPRYEETIRYLQKLSNKTSAMHLTYFGESPQGRKLPLVIVDGDACFTPSSVRKNKKAVVMIQACIHAGEPDGKDAGMMLIRDMLIHQQQRELLDRITILFIPIFNVDGHERFGPYNRINQNGPKEMGWRVTAQNLNLNRDYMKADAPEMRAWLNLFHQWQPDFFMDCHVTDGADYEYAVTYAIDQSENSEQPIRDWVAHCFLPSWHQQMQAAGFPVFPYVSPRKWNRLTSGLGGGVAPPRLSNGYGSIRNRPTLLIETHMFKDYAIRVAGTYQAILQAMKIIYQQQEQLIQAIDSSDRRTAEPDQRFIPLTFVTTEQADTVELRGYRYKMVYSRISGDSVMLWTKEPMTYRLPYYNHNRCTDSVQVPWAYVIPRGWTTVVNVLKAHGTEMHPIKRTMEIEVESYRFENIRWDRQPYEGRFRCSFRAVPIREKRTLHAGDWFIRMNQRLNKVILHLLEPNAPDSFVRWGFFHSIFEQKEYAENYKMEELAEEMIRRQPELWDEFTRTLKADSTLARDPYARYNWFYQRTPYWDAQVNQYPVSRILEMTKDMF